MDKACFDFMFGFSGCRAMEYWEEKLSRTCAWFAVAATILVKENPVSLNQNDHCPISLRLSLPRLIIFHHLKVILFSYQ